MKGKATTCPYTATCCNATCTQENDFTDIIVKDVFISGLVDDEIKKDILGWVDLDVKAVDETVSFVEAKEMACDVMNKPPLNATISGYKKGHTKPKTVVS